MAPTKKGLPGVDVSQFACSAETPGSLGINDQADPNILAVYGNTPGTIGIHDHAANQCRVIEDVFVPRAESATGTSDLENSGDVEVFLIEEDLLLRYSKETFSYTGAALDFATLVKALQDFGFKDIIKKGSYYTKTYSGKVYIIFKGYPGLRKTLTAPKYLMDNTKVVDMMIGTKGLIKSGLRGSICTIVLVGAMDVLQYFLDDEETLVGLGVTLFSDISKTAISTVAGTAVAMAVAAATSAVVLPIAAGIAVGIAVAKGLDAADERSQLTAALREWTTRETDEALYNAKRWWNFLNTPSGIEWLNRQMLGY